MVLGAGTVEEITSRSGLDARRAVRALGRLQAGGLLALEGGRYVALPEVLKASARAASPEPRDDTSDPVLRAFMKEGRLVSIPAAHGKRLVILDHLAQEFEPGQRYAEKEVNEILAGFHPDYASLRRYLVDDGFLERRAGAYWRSGGTFDVD